VDAAAGRPDPEGRLPPQARTLWRLEAAMRWAGAAVAAAVATAAVGDSLPRALVATGWAALALGAVLGVGIAPAVRWRRWRYAVREEEIDLRRGVLVATRTLVPIARVQHVDTRRGVLERSLGVATVVFHTAAGTNAIPALRGEEAAQVRDRIATLARTPDEL